MKLKTINKIDEACNRYKKIQNTGISKFIKLDDWLNKESNIFESEINNNKKTMPKFQRGEIIKIDFGINIGDDLTITYPLKTKRGFQLWKWYIKLDNDIDLKFTAGYDFSKTIRRYYDPDPGFDMWEKESGTDGVYKEWEFDGYKYTAYKPKLELTERTVPSRTHEWFLRPSAAYQLNKMVSTSAYVEYRQIHEKLDDETAHIRQILTFELALMLRFN